MFYSSRSTMIRASNVSRKRVHAFNLIQSLALRARMATGEMSPFGREVGGAGSTPMPRLPTPFQDPARGLPPAFEADGKPDETGRNPLCSPLFGCEESVTRGRGMAQGRRDVAQAGGVRDVLEGLDESIGLIAAADVEAHHRAGSVTKLACDDQMVGMTGKTGVIDAFHAGMTGEAAGNGLCGRAGAFDPEGEGCQTAKSEPAIEWVAGETESRPNLCESVDLGFATEEKASSVTSLWPPISLVAEWITTSAPRAIGRQSKGARRCGRPRAEPPTRARLRPNRRCLQRE